MNTHCKDCGVRLKEISVYCKKCSLKCCDGFYIISGHTARHDENKDMKQKMLFRKDYKDKRLKKEWE